MIRRMLPWKWIKETPAVPILPPPTTRNMRKVTVDAKRRATVISRHARWRSLRDEPRHREAVTLIGPTSIMGHMTAGTADGFSEEDDS